MRIVKKITLLISLLFLPLSGFSAEKSRVVLHLSDQQKLQMLVNNVTNIRKALGDRADIIIVVNGPAVTRFARFANTEKQVQKILSQDAEISVCSIALRNRKILKDQLIEGIVYLEQGGVARLIELQQQQYSYIKI